MKIKELKQLLANIPDDADIYFDTSDSQNNYNEPVKDLTVELVNRQSRIA